MLSRSAACFILVCLCIVAAVFVQQKLRERQITLDDYSTAALFTDVSGTLKESGERSMDWILAFPQKRITVGNPFSGSIDAFWKSFREAGERGNSSGV